MRWVLCSVVDDFCFGDKCWVSVTVVLKSWVVWLLVGLWRQEDCPLRISQQIHLIVYLYASIFRIITIIKKKKLYNFIRILLRYTHALTWHKLNGHLKQINFISISLMSRHYSVWCDKISVKYIVLFLVEILDYIGCNLFEILFYLLFFFVMHFLISKYHPYFDFSLNQNNYYVSTFAIIIGKRPIITFIVELLYIQFRNFILLDWNLKSQDIESKELQQSLVSSQV